MISSILRENIERSLEVHGRLLAECLPELAAAAEALISAYRTGRKAIFFGNGGSAADAQHLAAEFVGRYLRPRDPLPALALNVNSSAVTAIGNDYGYDEVFARQLEALAVPGDVAVGISTSGNSENVIRAVIRARQLGLSTVALTGSSGGHLRGLVDVLIAAPSDETPRIQECHILIGHALCDVVEQTILMKREVSHEGTTIRPQSYAVGEYSSAGVNLCRAIRLRAAQALEYRLVVLTNQAGIARGYYTEREYLELTDWMVANFLKQQIQIARVYHCPYHPIRGIGEYRRDSFDRKSNPGMLLRSEGRV